MAGIENFDLPAVESQSSARAARRVRSILIMVWVMGLFVLLWFVNSQGMSIGEGSPEAGFSRDMIVHHAQAVEMALLLYDRTENPTLHAIALDILLSQQTQIGQMQGWLYLWGLPIAGSDLPMAWMGMVVEGLMPGMANDEQMAALRASTGTEADRQFIELMIPHHQRGIHMAQAIIGHSSVPVVQDFARSVIETQQREITELEKERAKIS